MQRISDNGIFVVVRGEAKRRYPNLMGLREFFFEGRAHELRLHENVPLVSNLKIVMPVQYLKDNPS